MPPTPSGIPLELRIDGLPKRGCLRTSSELVKSDLIRPGLTFSQAPTMLFHMEHLSLLSLGAARSQFRSRFEGPLPWTESLVWSTLCHTSYFQGSPPGVRPLMKSLASNTFDWALGSVTPRPPWEVGSARVSHLTLACVGASLPPQIKFLMNALTWLHILGSGFQHAARYQIDASRTWFATRILPASESLLLLQLMSLPLKANIIVSKFASGGKWNPT